MELNLLAREAHGRGYATVVITFSAIRDDNQSVVKIDSERWEMPDAVVLRT